MDEIDKLHAAEERRAKLRDAVRARLAEIEVELPVLIQDVSRLRRDKEEWEDKGFSNADWNDIQWKTERRDALVAEHAVLEGLLDRPVARWVPRLALGVGLVSLAWQIIAALWKLKS